VDEIYNQAEISKDESELIKLLQKSFQLVKEVVNKTTLPNLDESEVDKILKILDDKSLKKLEKILDAQTVEKYGAISKEINSNVKRMVGEFFRNSKKMVGGDDVDECSICKKHCRERFCSLSKSAQIS